MERKFVIADTDLAPLFPLGLGTVSAGLRWDGKAADSVFGTFLEYGGNLIDSARVYSDWIPPETGRSERAIGDWLCRSGKRSQVVLMTKGGHASMRSFPPDLHKVRLSKEEMTEDLELSLRALRTDCIDIYLYHRDDERRPVEELVETMESFVRQGKIRYYGCSNWGLARIQEADAYCSRMGYRGFVVNESLYNLGHPHMEPPRDDTLRTIDLPAQEYHRQNPGCLAVAYSGNCGGFFQQLLTGGEAAVREKNYLTEGNLRTARRVTELTEKYSISILQAVLGYFTQLSFPCLPLFGPRDAENLREALETFRIPFTPEDYRGISETA